LVHAAATVSGRLSDASDLDLSICKTFGLTASLRPSGSKITCAYSGVRFFRP